MLIAAIAVSAACGPANHNGRTDATEDFPFVESGPRDVVGGMDTQFLDSGGPPADAADVLEAGEPFPDAAMSDAGMLPAEIALGAQFGCARVSNGTVRCWGVNTFGQIGDGSRQRRVVPTTVAGITSAIQLGVGGAHACALLADRTVRCWGANESGQLGDGSLINRLMSSQVLGLSNVAQIALGGAHTCARMMDATVRCWGAGSLGQLGNGGSAMAVSRAALVPGLNGVTQISAGALHTCVIVSNGNLRCWGSNAFGQLGDGSTNQSLSPILVSMLTGAAQVVAGPSHTCARLTTRLVRCWGRNADGEIGDNTMTDRLIPTGVPGFAALDMDLGGGVPTVSGFTCAMGTDDTPRCWGDNASGQLGDGTIATRTTPTIVLTITNQLQIATGGAHTCAIANDMNRTLRCWGLNDEGQLGIGVAGMNRSLPALVTW